MKNSTPIMLKFVMEGYGHCRDSNGKLRGSLQADLLVDGQRPFTMWAQRCPHGSRTVGEMVSLVGLENFAELRRKYRAMYDGWTRDDRISFKGSAAVSRRHMPGRVWNNLCLGATIVASDVLRMFSANKRAIEVLPVEEFIAVPPVILTPQQRRKAERLAKHQEFMAALNEVKAAREAREAEVRQNRSKGAKAGWAKRNEKRMEAARAIGAGRLQQWSAAAAYVL